MTTAEGQECELSARADGTLVYVECVVGADELPEAARETVERLVPGGEIAEVETKQGPEIDAIHVEVRASDGSEHYLRFTGAGELTSHGIRIPATIEVPVP